MPPAGAELQFFCLIGSIAAFGVAGYYLLLLIAHIYDMMEKDGDE